MTTSPVVRFDELLGHVVRSDPALEQGNSSYALALSALQAGEFERARDYGTVTVQEASEAYDLYASWLRQIPKVLSINGTGDGPVRDLDTGWEDYRRAIAAFADACQKRDADAARMLLDDARRTWQRHHDRACDTICGLFDLAGATRGEAFVGELWDQLLTPMYERAAAVYDPAETPWSQATERLLLDIFEATRGHLTGPHRDGAFTVAEDDDRWVITFAPCGSGGRTYDRESGSPSVTTQRHDWAWNTTGVCLYCAHCCQLQQRAPIARLGFPLRVVNPPVQGPGHGPAVCTWSVYKDPTRVPDEAYTSVGFRPPKHR
ncbi:hypothetical protein EV589_5854 [Mycobacterium sp. BK558]|nr:hypothetical protein EV589_5854 [Mycobacterium sp. BK558]